MEAYQKRRVILLALAGIMAAVALIAFVIFEFNNRQIGVQPAKPFTGNQNPNADKIANSSASVAGLDALINTAGLTLDQTTAVRLALQKYPPFNNGQTYVAIQSSSLRPAAPDASDKLYRPSVFATILVNAKTTYKVRIYYWGTSTIQLLIFDKTNTRLFDSKIIDGTS